MLLDRHYTFPNFLLYQQVKGPRPHSQNAEKEHWSCCNLVSKAKSDYLGLHGTGVTSPFSIIIPISRSPNTFTPPHHPQHLTVQCFAHLGVCLVSRKNLAGPGGGP